MPGEAGLSSGGGRRERSRSPRLRGRGGRGGARSAPREGRERNGRPRKTQEELDAEMDNYWGSKGEGADGAAGGAGGPETDAAGDVDMIT